MLARKDRHVAVLGKESEKGQACCSSWKARKDRHVAVLQT